MGASSSKGNVQGFPFVLLGPLPDPLQNPAIRGMPDAIEDARHQFIHQRMGFDQVYRPLRLSPRRRQVQSGFPQDFFPVPG